MTAEDRAREAVDQFQQRERLGLMVGGGLLRGGLASLASFNAEQLAALEEILSDPRVPTRPRR
jgi:hypothetical protein